MENVGQEMKQLIQEHNFSQRYKKLMETALNDPDVQTFIQKHREQITEEQLKRSYAKLYEFVQERKKFRLNDPTMLAPGYEPKLALTPRYIDVVYVPTQELLAKQRAEEIRRHIKAFDISKEIQTATLNNFDTSSEGRMEALALSMQFLDSYEKMPKAFHKGVYLQGVFGIGKSYLLGAIANALAEKNFTTTIVHFPTFAVEMKQAIGKDLVGEKLTRVKKSSILMIDDIGAEAMTSWIRDDILGVILQYRMQEQLATCFSSNLNFKELENHLTVTQKGEQEPLKAKRIMERIKYLSKEVTMSGEDRRYH
ncbi:primosomal protein DnaI [Melissococcus plutonius]|uniref:Helicase loader DnaI n=1 Tax=Melissococcus plutonius TaxID=33970 RepID=A0A2Z5Y119_9ENTE|nr:primosomal protein DnaI [Melissococcus plutonius]BAL61711.1 helicase loader DnaI [Melissococcus plutonius DAT561]MCV2498345.1 primosomal protein DnaI [Melissococcus plutonius]MCV2500440.1 primosomal protein DnaI [Melissococcus plutonius]MCV2504544.1 primosomal protein DnaI [Melissococcus plutonius]MCV2506960.1 primosomal protein DnaI [Melissococcus plutonius]